MSKLCYWCHEPLPPLPKDASYVDEINHYIHDVCREERDEQNRRMEELRASIASGSIDSIPEDVRSFVLERIKSEGFSRRCPCLYDEAYGFQGYDTHSLGGDEADDYDARNSVDGCELCGGSGNYDRCRSSSSLPTTKRPNAGSRKSFRAAPGPASIGPDSRSPVGTTTRSATTGTATASATA